MLEKKLYKNSSFFTAFPSADEVFVSEIEKEFLLPLGVYHLEVDERKHDVLLAIPIGNEEGMLGKSNIGEFCGETWLTYSNQNGKWALDCSVRDLESFSAMRGSAHYSYASTREKFLKAGKIEITPEHGSDPIQFELFRYGGLATNYGNWFSSDFSNSVPFMLKHISGKESEPEKAVTILDSDGDEYLYLGAVAASHYSGELLAFLRFFFNPGKQRVMVVHEFS
ncbi:hypothetical protein [Hahella sp. HN01]|uniref:hypothetical protein n=1 Tax=Hahella sp. HN01 TaxID=2847262 RepID=UPI001C1EF653|nr:hypothetical protein [Hahella sp. HN01]MBU6953577.1 hypothetical protein [Hahella sp. HN01]